VRDSTRASQSSTRDLAPIRLPRRDRDGTFVARLRSQTVTTYTFQSRHVHGLTALPAQHNSGG
jgi:hypothetical protein